MKMLKPLVALLGVTAFSQAEAAIIDFVSGPLTLNARSVTTTQGGVTTEASGYHAELSGGGAWTIYGPFTTSVVDRFQNFGNCTRLVDASACDVGLGLNGREALGQFDLDGGNGGLNQPGFDNFGSEQTSIQFAMFAFDRPVDVSQVILRGASNYGLDIWVAGGNSAPNFSLGLSAFDFFTVITSHNNSGDASGGVHNFTALNGITYLIVGTPLPSAAGPYGGIGVSDGDQFYISGLNLTPAPVPLPAASWLLLSGIGALGFLRRRADVRA